MTLDLATVIRATGARIFQLDTDGSAIEGKLHLADLSVSLAGVFIDSRRVEPGGMFVGLPGERVDGADFAPAALAAGARACLVSRIPPAPAWQPERSCGSAYWLVVPDALAALQRLAACWREQSRAEIIGITGSIGKTTTKEIVAGVIGHVWPVLKNAGNLNNEIGLPLTLLRLRPEHRAAVLEMGMYVPGDIALLAEIARPRIGVVTNVEPVHLERAGSIERIAGAKSELVAALPQDGLAVLNGDDPWTRAMATSSGLSRSVLVGAAHDCDYRIEHVADRGLEGTSIQIRAGGESHRLDTAIPGAHFAFAFAAAMAVGRELGLSWAELTDAAAEARLDVRQQVLHERPGMLIIDDTYNAAPPSVRAALALLGHAPGAKVAVLGDMLELGPGEEEAHRAIGAAVAQSVDWLVSRGRRAAWIAESAESAGLPGRRIIRVDSNEEAARAIERIVSAVPVGAGGRRSSSGGETGAAPTMRAGREVQWSVLVKGSRGMEMEQIVDMIRGRP